MSATELGPVTELEPAIELRSLTKCFGAQTALDGVSLRIVRGARVVVIGASGSGKTLLLKSIVGIERYDGTILIDGVEQGAVGQADRFGMQFQQSALFDSMSVWENIAFRALQRGQITAQEAKKSAVEFLRRLGLPATTADLSPGDLSGGMQKRVGLARAAFDRPDFLILDEPTAGLDPIMSSAVAVLINDLSAPRSMTTLSVCSDLATVRRIADRVVMLDQGTVVWSGAVAELDSTDNPYVRQFVDKSSHGPIQSQ